MWMAAKLFEKKRHTCNEALIAKNSKPHFLCRARTSLAFTSSNQPMNARQIELVERTKKGLSADEPHRGGDAA